LKDGRISLPYNPKQIIFIGTIEPLKPVKTTNQKMKNKAVKCLPGKAFIHAVFQAF
jgi:hypothetical protein